MKDELLYLKNTNRLAIPDDKNLKAKILFEFHDAPIAGYIGIDKIYVAVSQQFYWPKMNKSIHKYITSCESCQRNKSNNQ